MNTRGLIAIAAALALVLLCACAAIAAVAYMTLMPARSTAETQSPSVETAVTAVVQTQPTTRPEDLPTPGPTATPLPAGELNLLEAQGRAINNVNNRVS